MSLLAHPRPPAVGLSTLGRDPFLRVLALLALLQAGFLSAHLIYPDLNLDYPFMDGDSWDWIANGLRLAGHDVRSSGRSPLLPLAINFLDRLSLLSWLPVVLVILFHGTVLAFYPLAARSYSRGAAFAATLALLVNHSLLGISLQVMADVPASCLLFLAARSWILAGDDPGEYVKAGAIGGLASVAQPIGVLAAAPAVLSLALRRRNHSGSRPLWIGAAAFVAPPALWAAFRALGAPDADIPARQLQLLAFDWGSAPFYGRASLSFLGLPACVLLAAGLGIAVREAWRGSDSGLFNTALFATLTGFFVFLYSYEAGRFLVYPIWMAGLLIAGALARLPKRAFGVAAVLLIAGSALPPSGEPSVHARVRSTWQSRRSSPRLDPELVRQDRSALYLYQQPSDGGGRYRVITRMGNALRKKVKYVPASWLEPWQPQLRITPLGAIGPDMVWRARLPHLRETWAIVMSNGGGRREGSGKLAEGLRQARLINSHLAGWDGYVALVPGNGPPEPWQLYLPFLIETTELYVPRPGEEEEILRIFAAAPSLGERRIGSVAVRRTQLLGRRATLVRGLVRGTTAPRQ